MINLKIRISLQGYVNRKCHFRNKGSLETTSTVPLNPFIHKISTEISTCVKFSCFKLQVSYLYKYPENAIRHFCLVIYIYLFVRWIYLSIYLYIHLAICEWVDGALNIFSRFSAVVRERALVYIL